MMKRQCGRGGWDISRSFRSALYVASMVCLWSIVAAQLVAAPPAAPPTAPTAPPSHEGSRELVSTVWGFILTMVALSLDDWGSFKNYSKSLLLKVLVTYGVGALNPIMGLYNRMQNLMVSWKMTKRMSTPEYSSKDRSYIRILSGCTVVVVFSPTGYENFTNLQFHDSKGDIEDFSDAIVIGEEVDGSSAQLSGQAKEMLVKAKVLPPIERLKVLQANSGLAVLVSTAQGVGYIYSILVRVVQGLHVAPIEVVGFYLSTIILLKAMLHYFTSNCHRPLVLFLNPEKEGKFINECKKLDNVPNAKLQPINFNVWMVVFNGGIIILVSGGLVYFIITIIKSTFFSIGIPLIILAVGIVMYTIESFTLILQRNWSLSQLMFPVGMVGFFLPIVNMVGYVYSLVLTAKYWKSLGFNIERNGYLSNVLPYIG